MLFRSEVVDPYQQRFFKLFAMLKEQNLLSASLSQIYQGDLSFRIKLSHDKKIAFDPKPLKSNVELSPNSKPINKNKISAVLGDLYKSNNVSSSDNKNINVRGLSRAKTADKNSRKSESESKSRQRTGVGTLVSEHEFRIYNEDLLLESSEDGKEANTNKQKEKLRQNNKEELGTTSGFGGGFI